MAFIETSSGEIVVSSPDDIGVWDDERGLCVSGLVPKRERLRILRGGCSARPGAPPERTPRENLRMIVLEAAQTPRRLRDLAHAFYASRVTGLSVAQVLELNAVLEPKPMPGNRFGNVEPAPIPLHRVKSLFPEDVNEEMGFHDSASPHYGGMGTGIDVDRIKGTSILIFTVSRDDC